MRGVVLSLLDALAFLFFLDYFTNSYTSELMYLFSWTLLHANRWSVIRALLTIYLIQRVGFFVWRRYSVQRQLKKKQADLLHKHNQLANKITNCIPEIDHEETARIAQLSLPELRQRLKNKIFTAQQVIEAFQLNAVKMWCTNLGCIAEIVYDADVYSILADGKFDDERECSPLNGIPVALSEIFRLCGCDQTMGYVVPTCGMVYDDCTFVSQLRTVGAVPFLTTNVRQEILGLSVKNPVYGTAKHPMYPNRVCVGGVAVVIALHYAPLGFEADSIGEARLGAAFCGVCCFKPTTGRMSQKGLNMPIHFPNLLEVIPSPMGRSVSDLIEALIALWQPESFTLDCNLYPAVYNKTLEGKSTNSKLCIGYFTGFSNLVYASSPVERMMENCRQSLVSKGHRLVAFKVPEVERAYELVIGLLSNVIQPDILQLVYQKGNGDVLVNKKTRILHMMYALPASWRHALCQWRADAIQSSSPTSALVIRGMGTTKSYAELVEEALDYRNVFFNAWNEAQLDCLVCPVSPIPAPVEDAPFHVTTCCYLFTALFNLVGSPCGSLPMDRVQKTDIDLLEHADLQHATSLVLNQELKGGEGLSMGIQVVGRPWEDETVLGVMQLLEEMRPDDVPRE